ncbi:hypothetical protein N7478_000320 [Penicillium angulare]|uniref:uncharacterized protein n=1 Tax=Penicillium angulare TaxID=116970 RepID=UPI00254133F2|nr:uncharacterized protein N7478_000320 [Penicillium angulare]KAJ5291069.1 hypothetical protein N7478_000320 [Penicillium angulare]
MLCTATTSSILLWILSAGSLLVLWLIGSSIYHLYFSPLSSFPGPRLWAFSYIPLQLSVLRGQNHLDVTALHDRYGPVVRISPTEMAFNTPQAFRDIYGYRSGGCFPKDRSRYITPANGVDHLVSAVDNAAHARQRRLLSHAFSDHALRDQEGLIRGYVDTLISKLRTEVEKKGIDASLDIKNWMNYTTFDITGDLMFGESFDCLKDSQLHPWIRLIFSSIKAISFASVAQQFPLLRLILDAMIPKKVARTAKEHFNLAAQRVDRRLDANISRPDFISAILQNGLSEAKGAYMDGKRIMSRAEIHSNAFILIVAGSETSATLLSGCIFYLCINPHAMRRLTAEIRSAFANDKDITFRTIASLKYLAAVIEESLRMYPPFVTSLSRIVPKGGSIVDGEVIAEGTAVACHHYASYHSASNFTFPHSFLPERWLGQDPRFVEDKRDVLQPFSLGPRNCLGKNLAYCEIRLILCKLLYNFDVVLCPESSNWANQKAYFLWDKPALMVTLQPCVPEQKET